MSIAVTKAASDDASLQDGWVPVSVESLRSITELAFDLYIPMEDQVVPRLYRGRDIPLRATDITRLLDRGMETLYTPASMASIYRDHLRERVLADESIPLTRRYQMLAQAARVVFEDALRERDVAAMTAVSNDLGRQITKLVTGEEFLLLDLIEVMLHDYTTYAHATRVCTYALLIAKSIGIYDREDLLGIAKGALLHDVGKLFISDQIVAKNYRVTPEERELMREHPTQGFLRLARRDDLQWGTVMMVYQHHERVDGCGYPVGLPGDEIHEWARICSIANTYDALMRDRSVHDEAAMRQVIRNLDLQSGRSLDEEITRCWMEMVTSNPPRA